MITAQRQETECRAWIGLASGMILCVAFVTVLFHINEWNDWTAYTKFALVSGSIGMIAWCIWVLRTFLSIISWWKNLQSQMTLSLELLSSSKKELEEIKKSFRAQT